ncbi:Putative 115 kDa protein in type-1 retrotransposable element R1DM [Eumeta japonica]|uniref:115 kDa protein in type-1 retrotransposable element R1DM n=1 Tax=Eumeta variegata TaxID=151549 RepID=A0A4C1XJL7_EUMVA|nr:Putative 115 kDa protein in type-1 retrotransposable element R1DM [Eumeta japonica]
MTSVLSIDHIDAEKMIEHLKDSERDHDAEGPRSGCSEGEAMNGMVQEWQERWDGEVIGRELYRFFPEVSVQLRLGGVGLRSLDHIFTRHSCLHKRLYDLGFNDTSVCLCGLTDEDMLHVLWSYNDKEEKS